MHARLTLYGTGQANNMTHSWVGSLLCLPIIVSHTQWLKTTAYCFVFHGSGVDGTQLDGSPLGTLLRMWSDSAWPGLAGFMSNMVLSHGGSWFWLSAGAVEWSASTWPPWGLEFLKVWQSQDSNNSYLTVWGTKSECFKNPKKKLKGFWWSGLRSPKESIPPHSIGWNWLSKAARPSQIQGEGN